MAGDAPAEKVVPYMCPGCETIVRIDLELDEVRSSSSSGSYRAVPRRRTVLVADDSQEILTQGEALLSGAGDQVLPLNTAKRSAYPGAAGSSHDMLTLPSGATAMRSQQSAS